jgi:hypothetical protein
MAADHTLAHTTMADDDRGIVEDARCHAATIPDRVRLE